MNTLEIVRSLEKTLLLQFFEIESDEVTRSANQTLANEVKFAGSESRILVMGSMLEISAETCNVAGVGTCGGLHISSLVKRIDGIGFWDTKKPDDLDLTLATLRFARACHRWLSYSDEHKIVWANIWKEEIAIKRILTDFCSHHRKLLLLWEESDSEVIESDKFEYSMDSTLAYFKLKKNRHFVG